jgi:hypothetical protein
MILDVSGGLINTGMPVMIRNTDYNQVVISVISFLVICLIIAVKVAFKGYYTNLFISIWRPDSSARKQYDSGTGVIASTLSGIAAILSVTATVMVVMVYFRIPSKLDLSPLAFLLISLASSAAYYVFYKTSLTFLGYVVDVSEQAAFYSTMKSDYYKVMSLLLLPLFVIFPHSDPMMYKALVIAMAVVALIIFLINIFSFFSYLIKIKFLNHYTILYFCILEILPLLVVAKLIGI